jgi:hypothetical protein
MKARKRLIEALDAIARTDSKVPFRTAFLFLGAYVPGAGRGHDSDLSRAFVAAFEAMSIRPARKKAARG